MKSEKALNGYKMHRIHIKFAKADMPVPSITIPMDIFLLFLEKSSTSSAVLTNLTGLQSW